MRKPAPKGPRTAPATRKPAASRPATGAPRPPASARPAAGASPARHGPPPSSGAGARSTFGAPTRRPAINKTRPAAKLAPRKPAPPPGGAPPRPPQAGQERLQKILAAAGIASRRACEQIILDGRVQVNGKTVIELGTSADPRRDEITVDLVPIHREAPVYILMNKPKGYVTTVKDDQGRPTVMALLKGVPGASTPWAAWTSTPRACCS